MGDPIASARHDKRALIRPRHATTKERIVNIGRIGLIVLCWLCILPGAPVWAADRAGIVTALEGQAWAEGAGQRRTLALKAEIQARDTVITDAGSRLSVLFEDDTILSLGPSATVRVEDFAYGGQTPALGMRLVQGVARVVSGKIVEQNPEAFKLSSPLAVIGIRGTITQHDVTPDQERHFVEYLGSGHTVWIKGPDGVIVTIEQSLMGIDLRPGQPTPRAPRPMTREERMRGIEATLSARPAPGSALQGQDFPPMHELPQQGMETVRDQDLQREPPN
jgi:hypothetical protein